MVSVGGCVWLPWIRAIQGKFVVAPRTIFIRGSSRTLPVFQASVAIYANLSLTSLCRITSNPPFLHDRPCCFENFAAQPSQFSGRYVMTNPYLIAIPSLNSSFDRDRPFISVGVTDVRAPVVPDRSTEWRNAQERLTVRSPVSSLAFSTPLYFTSSFPSHIWNS